ncbi:MAG TPA: polysaccharide biosynthesis/export family protein [Thermodesulfovibrionales bacterium]|nr:polysaccharide biosynthesis/export family protein [Thermodesulfovibrionales bacterium]
MKKICLLTASTAFGFLLLSGCGGNKQVNVQMMDSEIKDTRVDDMNALLLRKAMTAKVDENAVYIIGPDDVMDIEVSQAEELRRTVKVSPQGYFGMPLIGEIKAKGLTPAQLEKEIAGKFEKYLQEPRVSITVKEYKAQKIAVVGAVASPNVFAVTGQKYLLDMLIMAGGLVSNPEVCYIMRPTGSKQNGSGETEIITVKIADLIEKGDFSLNVPVFHGDMINVPKKNLFFVDGEVNRPGPLAITSKMTLREAIITAGGLRFEADASDVQILRDKGDGRREIIPVNYNNIRDGKIDDVAIKEKDIVVVGASGLRTFVGVFYRFLTGSVSSAGTASVGVSK